MSIYTFETKVKPRLALMQHKVLLKAFKFTTFEKTESNVPGAL